MVALPERSRSFERLNELAFRQHGVFATWQAAEAGVSSSALQRGVAAGHYVRLTDAIGAVRIAGAPETWLQKVMASVLSTGPQAAASHRMAAALEDLDGFTSAPFEIVVPRWNRRARPRFVVHESTDLRPADLTVVQGVPCTTVVRTLIDLGAVSHIYRVEQAFDDACRRRLCTVEQVRQRYLEIARRGRNGCGTIRTLLEARPGGKIPPGSAFEARTLRLIRTDPQIPEPSLQHQVTDGDLVAYIDLAWATGLVGLECQSMAYHSTPQRVRADIRRKRWLTRVGWWIIEVTWEDLVERPEEILRELRHALRARGVL